MINIQVCARCGTRWQNQGQTMQWCPKCHGVLLAPFRTDQSGSRSFRWVARSPGSLRRGGARSAQPARSTQTPHYTEPPRWGLVDRIPEPLARRDWADAAASNTPIFALWAALAYLLAAIAECVRYGILLHNRTRLIDPTLLTVSDVAVNFANAVGVSLAIATAVCGVFWLLRMRRRTFDAEDKDDPRTRAQIIRGCAIPVVNLVMPAIFLLETVRHDPRTLRLVRLWWSLWVLGGVLLVVNLGWRFRTSLQAMADGVLLAAFTSLVAAATALVTALMIRRCEHRTLRGKKDRLVRWVPAPPGVVVAGANTAAHSVLERDGVVADPNTATDTAKVREEAVAP